MFSPYVLELVVKSSEQDNYSLVQLQCMQELPRQSLGYYQKFKQENVVGSKMKQLELQPQEKTEMDKRGWWVNCPTSTYILKQALSHQMSNYCNPTQTFRPSAAF